METTMIVTNRRGKSMERIGKRVIAVAMALVLSIGSVAFYENDAVAAATVKLSAKSLTLIEGHKETLKLENATGKITWNSSHKEVASVSSKGVITAKKAGQTKVTAINNKKIFSCRVTVKKAGNFKAKKVKIYDSETKTIPFTLYFKEDSDIPYVNLEKDGISLLVKNIKPYSPNFKLTCKTMGNKLRIKRENGYYLDFDYDTKKVYYSDMNGFFRFGKQDLIGALSFEGTHTGLYKKSSVTYYRHGSDMSIDLKKYGIPIGTDGKKHYIPLQTYNDLLLSRYFRVNLAYNRKDLFYRYVGFGGKLFKKYKSAPKHKVSKEFVDFNYGELCMQLDHLYGLKDPHGIKDFDVFFENTGLKSKLKSYKDNATKVDLALDKMITQYLDDGNSGFSANSASYNSSYDQYPSSGISFSDRKYSQLKKKMTDAVDKYYPDGAKCYEEVGDTAYIKFDHFTDPTSFPNYMVAPTKKEIDGATPETVNTIRLMQYAYDQITANKDTISRVVLDLSMNDGGVNDAALYVAGAFLGEGIMAVKDVVTGALENNVYKIDLNRDKKFDEKDSIRAANKNLKLFCLTSGLSFSCGNFLPCVFKESKEVGLIGQTTGGGSCVVGYMGTASGSFFQVSGSSQISFNKNGSFYDVDRGADPDHYIYDLTKMLDRTYMNYVLDKLD